MCGIWLSISSTPSSPCASTREELQLLEKMTQLHSSRGPDLSKQLPLTSPTHQLTFNGHVLWTQGPSPQPQPHTAPSFSFLFNGDIYSFSGEQGYESFNPDKNNDGLTLFSALTKDIENIGNVVSGLRGPFAFILYHSPTRVLWFGRDFFGRQSLLFSHDKGSPRFHLSSVSVYPQVLEVPSAGIYKWELISNHITLIPYDSHPRKELISNSTKFNDFLTSCGLHPQPPLPHLNIPSTYSTKLFSHPPDQTLKKLMELSQMVDLSPQKTLSSASTILAQYTKEFLQHLRRSIQLRVRAVPNNCPIGILFSGGIDSTILAYLASEMCLPSQEIILLNAAFGLNPNSAPDRASATESFTMLSKSFANVRLVLVNESKERVQEMRELRIKTLISPLKSVLDDSIGCCLWFAAAGKEKAPIGMRAILVGSGADELLGGYSRHRSSFLRGGWESLASELQLDLDRISTRNMGRDNRVVSDAGVALRIPFLHEDLVHFLAQLPVWAKCFPPLGRGLGEKLLLRTVAHSLFGENHPGLALYPKRAMQFGSRIAKMENSKERGDHVCDRLL